MQTKLPDGSVIVAGYVPRDAEYSTVGSKGSSLTKFSIKVGEKPPKDGEERGEAVWCRCTCWHAAARAASGIRKGDSVLAVGKLESRKYTDKNGEEKTGTELVCEFVSIMAEAQTAAPVYNGSGTSDFSGFDGNDSDLPF